jgi:hypothetical protein
MGKEPIGLAKTEKPSSSVSVSSVRCSVSTEVHRGISESPYLESAAGYCELAACLRTQRRSSLLAHAQPSRRPRLLGHSPVPPPAPTARILCSAPPPAVGRRVLRRCRYSCERDLLPQVCAYVLAIFCTGLVSISCVRLRFETREKRTKKK